MLKGFANIVGLFAGKVWSESFVVGILNTNRGKDRVYKSEFLLILTIN